MKKLSMLVALTLMTATMAFANGGSEQTTSVAKKEPKSISITFATGDVTTKEAIHDIVTSFNASQGDYKLQENLSISTGAYLDSLKTLNASGQMPDIFECRDVPVFVRAGMLEPLPADLEALFETTIPVYGTVYTAPIIAQYPHMILYNKALFDKWGISGSPKTYQEFLAICDQVKSHGMAPMAAGVADIWHIGFLFNYYYTNYCTHGDGDYIEKRYNGEVKFDNPDMIEAMRRLQDLFKNDMEAGFMSTKESQLVSLLIGEKAAMIYTGSWTIAQILEADPSFEIGFFPIPDDNGNVILHGGATSQGWALNKEAAKDSEKKAGFEAFVRYFFQKDQYAQFLQKTNSFPTTKEKMVYDTTDLFKGILDMNNKYQKSLMWNIGVGGDELPPSYRNWTYKKVQEMLMGKITAEELVKAMDTQWAVDTRDFNPTKLVEQSL
jgi:raffinose/stachyose/melibiose transport system substrate-binding protein